jgi:hypothetical protein
MDRLQDREAMNEWRISVILKCQEWGIAVDGGTYSAQRTFGDLPHVVGCHCACTACDAQKDADPRCDDLWHRLDSESLSPPRRSYYSHPSLRPTMFQMPPLLEHGA